MAVYSLRSSNRVFSLKVLLISTGVLSMAVILKLSIPTILGFVVSELPVIWSSLRSWLTPPYLYVVINGIIITIAASSRFHHKVDEQTETTVPEKIPADSQQEFTDSSGFNAVVVKNQVDVRSEFGYQDVLMKNAVETLPVCEGLESSVIYEQSEIRVSEVKTMMNSSEEEEDAYLISRVSFSPNRRYSRDGPTENFVTDKPPVSARFSHRKIFKASPEGVKALGVARPKRQDTLESTWKTLTEGRAMPLTRHLKKSETWETHGRHNNSSPQETFQKNMKKSETFKDRTNLPSSQSPTASPVSGKLKKEPSLSQDDLTRRVEAFIKKFNEEMRLQRQESLNQYKEMINRGAH